MKYLICVTRCINTDGVKFSSDPNRKGSIFGCHPLFILMARKLTVFYLICFFYVAAQTNTTCLQHDELCSSDTCLEACCSGCFRYYAATFVWLCQPCDDSSSDVIEPRPVPSPIAGQETSTPKPSPKALNIPLASERNDTINLIIVVASAAVVTLAFAGIVASRCRQKSRKRQLPPLVFESETTPFSRSTVEAKMTINIRGTE